MNDETTVAQAAVTAATAGGAGGALLGSIAAPAITYFDPLLRDAGWGLFIVGGAAGLSGTLGTRLLDLVVAGLKRGMGQQFGHRVGGCATGAVMARIVAAPLTWPAG